MSTLQNKTRIIFHSRKTFLFFDGDPWIKKSGKKFDVPIGGYLGGLI